MARSKSKNVGLIGLGIIGSRVAAALRKRGLQVFVWNRTPRLEQYFVGSPVEVAELISDLVADDAALLETVQLTLTHGAAHVTAHCTVAPESSGWPPRSWNGVVRGFGGAIYRSKVAAEMVSLFTTSAG